MKLMQRVARQGAMVPAMWRLEVANGLRSGLRRGRISLIDRTDNLMDLMQLPIITDSDTDLYAWSATLAFADRHDLTPYHACYLELAQRLALPLATLDIPLVAAAKAAKVKLIAL